MRAYKYFAKMEGSDGRAWLLRIVRNTFYTWLRKNQPKELTTKFDEKIHSSPSDPEALHLRRMERARLGDCIRRLPVEFREVLILREIEDMSYRKIAEVVGVPMGTVMSRLSRARRRLRGCLQGSPTLGAYEQELP